MVLFEGSEQHRLLNYFFFRCISFNNWKIALLFLIIHHTSWKRVIYPTHFHVTCSPFIGEVHTSSLINIGFTRVICFGQWNVRHSWYVVSKQKLESHCMVQTLYSLHSTIIMSVLNRCCSFNLFNLDPEMSTHWAERNAANPFHEWKWNLCCCKPLSYLHVSYCNTN